MVSIPFGELPYFRGFTIFGISKKPQSFDVSFDESLLSGGGGGVVTIGILLYDVSTIPCRHYNMQIFRIIKQLLAEGEVNIGKYLPIFTEHEANNCFSIITQVIIREKQQSSENCPFCLFVCLFVCLFQIVTSSLLLV